jgi:membrane-anchored protein YejM (alkaline phosphatase superfamily)
MSESLLPRARRQASAWLWLANLALAAAVGINYLAHVPETPNPKAWLFALPALVSTALVLTLLPGLSFLLLAHFLRSTGMLGGIQASFWTVFHVLLFADTRIYNAFRYHFNGQVWNLVYTRGSGDAIHLGAGVWLAITAGLAVGVALELLAWRWTLRRAEVASATPARRSLSRMSLVWLVILMPAVFVEKTIYAHSRLTRDRQITRLARLFPLYARLPIRDLLGLERPPAQRVELGGYRLDYPHARPAIDPGGPRPDVIVVVIDCLRADLLTPEHTPRLSAWAGGARRFADHLSGGNSTRFGLFSLFYGLHGSYWFPTLAERRAPVLIDALAELSYEFGIFGSASMDYPELRATCFSGIETSVHDSFPGTEAWQRDEQAAGALRDWLSERESSDAPVFAFLLLDSPHQTYSHPPDATPFLPCAPVLDYLTMTRNAGPTPAELTAVRNRYWNAVHHADAVAGALLEALDASPRFRHAIVAVTGDHGEEFRECGFFGHTSAFTREQVAVPFVLRGPGIEPGVETRPTSHVDFAPTVLEILGANPAGRSSWCLGENLLAPPEERRRVIAGWSELGVWTPGAILRIPLSAFDFDVEAYDASWRLLADDGAVLHEETTTLEQLGADCNRFLR